MFWNDALLGSFSLEDTNADTEHVSIIAFLCLIKSEDCKEYKIIIDKKRNKTTEEIITESIH